jgi:hypothetical protein
MSETEVKAPPKPRVTMVFTGRCIATTEKGPKPAFTLREVVDGEMLEKERVFLEAQLSGSVGLLYSFEIEQEEDGSWTSYYPTSQRYIGPWADEAERAVWQAQARAFEIEQSAIRLRKKAEGTIDMLEVLEPLRRKYSKTNATGKLALEVLILSYLRRTLE